jgi:hypothetical protein
VSKQSEAKIKQHYVAKAIPATCQYCKYFEFERIHVDVGMWGGYWVEKNLRCSIGEFAVNKMGLCREFDRKKI